MRDCNLRLTSISRIPRLKTEMQPEFSQWGGQTPAQRLFAASDDGLPRAAGPRGACCRRVCARAGAGSRRIVLRWGTRVVGGLCTEFQYREVARSRPGADCRNLVTCSSLWAGCLVTAFISCAYV